jgi:hypothetical protein
MRENSLRCPEGPSSTCTKGQHFQEVPGSLSINDVPGLMQCQEENLLSRPIFIKRDDKQIELFM